MQNLLTKAPSSVRDCLRKQLGAVAGKNSCEGPWSTSLSLRVSFVSQALKLPDRATISLGIANPLTGIDAAVHGSNNLHGWGAPSFTDPTLLFVRGFDPTSQTYKYDVNPRFGANRQASALNLAPMQLTLDVRLDVGPERERQDLFLRLRSGRSGKGNKLNETQIKQQYTRTYPNPFEQMLRQQDSLKLSNDVADSIAILNKTYGKAIDSIWTPVSKYLAGLPECAPRRTARSTRWRSSGRRRRRCSRRIRCVNCLRSSRCSSTTRRFGRCGLGVLAAVAAGSSAGRERRASACGMPPTAVDDESRGYRGPRARALGFFGDRARYAA
jgi:hypothetical protein